MIIMVVKSTKKYIGIKRAEEIQKAEEIEKLENLVNRSWRGRYSIKPDQIDIEFNNLAKKTHNPLVLYYIAKHTKDLDVLDKVLERSDSFNKSARELIVMNIASNRDTYPLTLDNIARGNYPLTVKMNIVVNPSTLSVTIRYLAVYGEDEKLKKLAKNFSTLAGININSLQRGRLREE